MMKEEKRRHTAAINAFNMVEKRVQDLKNKLAEADRDKKSAEATLEGVER